MLFFISPMYIGLWRWCINITITILDVIHRPVFYLIPNSTLQVCPYLTGNTLRLRFEPNRLMLSIGFWWWYINITITILDIIHRPVFYLKHNVSETAFCPNLQVEPSQLSPIDRANLCLCTGLETETIYIYWIQLNRFYLKTETVQSPKHCFI
jgi:hypothetical protein